MCVAESKAAKHRRNFQIDTVALFDPKPVLQRAVALEQRVVVVLRHGRVGEARFDVVHLRLHGKQAIEGRAGFFEDGAARMCKAVLREIPDGERVRFDDGAAVGFVEPCQHLQHCRLARAIGAAQANALAVRDLPRHALEQHPITERFCD